MLEFHAWMWLVVTGPTDTQCAPGVLTDGHDHQPQLQGLIIKEALQSTETRN